MASSHSVDIVKDLVVSGTATGLYDINGNPLASANIVENGNFAYSKAVELSPKSIEHVLTATCSGCTIVVQLEMSPDGINWCPCNLTTGNACTVTCTQASGDCTTQHVDVPVLQFVRVKLGEASEPNGLCSVKLNFTLN